MNRGYVIVAQNNEHTDYIKCAKVLCRNIKNLMPGESVTLLTDKDIPQDCFDNVILFPHGDLCVNDRWKLANDWQVYYASPYEYTIKIEADIFLPRSITHWWSILQQRDLIICSTIRDCKNTISKSRTYRKTFDDNHLPDVYNAITYFKKSVVARKFYETVRDIFKNWEEFKLLLGTREPATTDVVYGIAALIIGEEHCTMPTFTDMSMIHMKPGINNSKMNDWTSEFIYEIDNDHLRIGTIPQLYPFHYHVKEFANIINQDLYE